MTTVVRRVAALFVLASAIFATPALAFDISPGSLTIQAGDTATGSLSSLPIASDGQPGCLEAASGTSIYLSTVFSPPCGGQAGWTSSMTVRTIPATPAGTYTIVFQVCPTPGCSMGPDIRNAQPIQTMNWTVVVAGAPIPVDTVPMTPPPTLTAPAPPAQRPVATPTPTPLPKRSAQRPAATLPASQPTATPAPTTSPGGTASPTPSSLAAGVTAGLVLDHPAVRPGAALEVSGTGCSPNAATTISLPGSVTGTTTAGPDGAFQVSLHLPPSLHTGRYTVSAQCGVALSTLVDVQQPRSYAVEILAGSAVLALLLGGLVLLLLRLARRRR